MGQTWMVVANSFKVVREVLVTQGESVSDRPANPLQEEIGHGLGERVSHTHTQVSSQEAAFPLCLFTASNKVKPCVNHEEKGAKVYI